jgi:hypothetical protein
MPDQRQRPGGLRPEGDDPIEQQLWDDLGQLPEHQPSERLRREFYQRLSEAAKPRFDWWSWLRHPAVPAFAMLIIGLAVGMQINPAGEPVAERQLSELQAQVSALNITVALNLMQKDAAGDRLKGIDLAATLPGDDPRLTDALLTRVSQDSSQSVRTAAVDALGSRLQTPGVAEEIQRMMLGAESPLVQLALAELVMRWGKGEQQRQVIQAAEAGELLPEVSEYLLTRIERISA